MRRENNYNKEIWSKIKDYPNYEVSSLGRVMNIKTGRILRPNIVRGYQVVRLCNDEDIKSFGIHRLVAEAFILNPENLETVDHIDNNRTNNNVDNLQWLSRADNTRKAQGRRVNQYSLNGDYIATYASITEASRQTGIKYCRIYSCCNGKFMKGSNYIWQFI